MMSRIQGKKVGGVMPQRSATAVMGRFSSGSVAEVDGFSSELSQQEGAFHTDGYSFANVRVNGSMPGRNQRKSAVTLMGNRQPIQAKLALGAVGDKYEQEADKVARQVVSQINSPTQKQSAEQGQKAGEVEAVTQDIPASSKVMRLAEGGVSVGETVSQEVEQGIQQARGRGQPLADSIREPMEKAFGADFSRVRIHKDAQSHTLNRSVGACAFTTEQDIFFKPDEYIPGSRKTQEIIAHELTHVLQQRQGKSSKRLQRYNKISSFYAPNVDHQIDVLHKEFKSAYKSKSISELYQLNNTILDPNNLPKPISALKSQPKRVETLKATLDGQRRGGPRTNDDTQTAYGHLGEYERTIFGRRFASTYRGGHLIADEMLGNDSYVQENFAPQHVDANSPDYRVIETMAEVGPVQVANPLVTAKSRNLSWTMEVELKYDKDYLRSVKDLVDLGVIDSRITQTDSGQTQVKFPRRVPYSWKVKLESPSGYIFPQKQITGTSQLKRLHGTDTQAETQVPLTRTTSNFTLWGMGSVESNPSSSGSTYSVGGNQVETFALVQTQPEPETTQPEYDPTKFGLPPQPVVKPGIAPQILKNNYEVMDIVDDEDVKNDFLSETASEGMTKDFLDRLAEVVRINRKQKIINLKKEDILQHAFVYRNTKKFQKAPNQKVNQLINKLKRDHKLLLTRL